jgi:prepilin-type N-terminal cleavage/methylation domain-containing protein
MRRRSGFTLIEVLVTVAVVVVLVALAGPSFQNLIAMQRLRSITAQLVTDLRFARNEAVLRNTMVRLSFQSNAASGMTCYIVYMSSASSALENRCNCELSPGTACTGGNVEIRTVQIPSSLGVKVEIPINTEYDTAFAFDNITGGLFIIPTDDFAQPFSSIKIESYIDQARKLAVKINGTGRPTVCAPASSTMTETPCTPS